MLDDNINLYVMKHLLLFFLILGASHFGSSQEWAPVGAKWYFTHHHWGEDGVSYTTAKSVKDTIIKGQLGTKVVSEGFLCRWNTMYTYMQNDSVFVYNHDLEQFTMLYDFGATVGDLWEIFDIYGYHSEPIIMRIDSIHHVVFNDSLFKVLYPTTLNPEGFFSNRIIENVGSVAFAPTFEYCDSGDGLLRCYEDENVFYHEGVYECTESTVNIEDLNKSKINMFPNPSSSTIYFNHLEITTYTYKIKDYLGRVIMEDRLSNRFIDVNQLQSGLYYIDLYKGTKIVLTLKC